MPISVIDLTGKETSSIDLSARKPNTKLVKELYYAYLGSVRNAHSKTKKRDEVRGGGRKPWRQKGTGRARIGSTRAPHWTGGGVVFGPTGAENYSKNHTNAARKKAYEDALYLKAEAGAVRNLKELPEIKKTKEAAALLKKVSKGRRVLLVSDEPINLRAFRNIAGTKITKPSGVTIADIVDADMIVLFGEAASFIGRIK